MNFRRKAAVFTRMRTFLLGTALVGTLFVALPASQESGRLSDFLERPFASSGRISMDLAAGEYRITGGSDRIRMDWRTRRASELRGVRARADVRGREAFIATDRDSDSGFEVDIEVPRRADLYIRLTAGELTIEDVEGHKDVALHAGEINIAVGRPESYERVEASVWAGDVNAAPYGLSKGGLFRSIDWHGTGPYRLKARLKAGEVRLY
jgi:hypothetical protein